MNHTQVFRTSPLLALAFASSVVAHSLPAAAGHASALRLNAASKVTVVLATEATPSEVEASRELQHYLSKILGPAIEVIPEQQVNSAKGTLIYLGPTQFAKNYFKKAKPFAAEEWAMQTVGKNLILTGGRPRGTLYAAYHFLEEACGVRWWTAWEESVPTRKELFIPVLSKRSKPAFVYRDVYTIFAYEGGRFMARNRLNRQGDESVLAELDGRSYYGPPDHVHTFYYPIYMDPKKYYAAHPDWYVIDGKGEPSLSNSQLAMSNPEMRKEFLKNVLENIRNTEKSYRARQLPVPEVYSISPNDNAVAYAATPADKELVKANGGADSAILIDMVNYLADGVKEEFPHVYLDTLAYLNSERAPTQMKVRDNVIIRLADTTSNVVLPITAKRNTVMREYVESWSKICKNLAIWDYNITYVVPDMPHANFYTYPTDLRFLLKHGVRRIFNEFEEPVRGDMRDLKLWVLCKLLEDPSRDYDALVKDFTDGYYGAAGPYIRQYLNLLNKTAVASGADVTWFSRLHNFTYLTTDFLKEADRLYAKATEAVTKDPISYQRVAHARSAVDIATLKLFRPLITKWVEAGNKVKAFPLDRKAAGTRYLLAMSAQIDQRIPAERREKERQKVQDLVNVLTSGADFLPPPARFKNVPAEKLHLYDASNARIIFDFAKVVADSGSESGFAMRFEPTAEQLEKAKMPMDWGIYDQGNFKEPLTSSIKAAEVPGPGFHWYKLGDITLTGQDYIWIMWMWYIQNDIYDAFDKKDPKAKYEVWANIKFEGPLYPHGRAEDKNTISVGRIAVVKK